MADNIDINPIDEFLLSALEEELPGFKMPNIGEMGSEFLIDKLGVIKDRRKRMEKYEKLLVEAVKNRDLKTDFRGNRFRLIRNLVPATIFSQEIAKTYLTAVQIEECYVESERDTVLIKEI